MNLSGFRRWGGGGGTLQMNINIMPSFLSVPEPIKTSGERVQRWESIIIDGVQESLQDIKSSFGESKIRQTCFTKFEFVFRREKTH